MKTLPSKSQVDDFFDGVVWKEFSQRIATMLQESDRLLEESDPFKHGEAVGQRRALRNVLSLQEIFEKEARNESPYGGNNKIKRSQANV